MKLSTAIAVGLLACACAASPFKERGDRYLSQGKHDRAVAHYLRAGHISAEAGDGLVEERIAKARRTMNRGNLDAAVAGLRGLGALVEKWKLEPGPLQTFAAELGDRIAGSSLKHYPKVRLLETLATETGAELAALERARAAARDHHLAARSAAAGDTVTAELHHTLARYYGAELPELTNWWDQPISWMLIGELPESCRGDRAPLEKTFARVRGRAFIVGLDLRSIDCTIEEREQRVTNWYRGSSPHTTTTTKKVSTNRSEWVTERRKNNLGQDTDEYVDVLRDKTKDVEVKETTWVKTWNQMKDTIWTYRVTLPSVRLAFEDGYLEVPLEIDFTYESHDRRKQDGKTIYEHKLPDAPGCNPNTQEGNHCDDLKHLASLITERLVAAESALRAKIKQQFANQIVSQGSSPGHHYFAVRLSPKEPPAAAGAWFSGELGIPADELAAVLDGTGSTATAGAVDQLGLPATDKGVTSLTSGGVYARRLTGLSAIGTGFTPPWADLDNRLAIGASGEYRFGDRPGKQALMVTRIYAGGVVDGDVSGWNAGYGISLLESSIAVDTGIGYERLSPKTSADSRLYRNLFFRQEITGAHNDWLATVFSIKWNLIKFKDWLSDGPTTVKHHTPITLGLRTGFSYLTVGVDGVFWWGMEPLSDSFGLIGTVGLNWPLL